MSYNGSGVFNINTSGQPVVTGTVISSTAFNALTADLATGLTTALTKDGQTTPTANIKLGGFKLTGIGVATTSGDALSYGQAATVSTLTNSALTSGRVTYASTAGLLTDSSGLTYDGTNLNIGTSTSVTNRLLNVQGSSVAKPVLVQTTTTNSLIEFNDSGTATKPAMGSVGDALTFWPAGVEGMRLTSTGLGIGTTSPTKKLEVSGSDAIIYGLTVGRGAGAVATNTTVGASAFANNSSGSSNAAFGFNALFTNGTGAFNSGFGQEALYLNSSGYSNSAFGYYALRNTTGQYNTAVGASALQANTTASNNTAVGYQAGTTITTGSNNTYIGTGANASGAAVTGEIVIASAGTNGKGSNTGFINPGLGGVYQGNNSSTWSVASDQRLKKNIVDNNSGLDKILAIQVRNFEYRLPEEITEFAPTDAVKKSGVQLGVIAQEIQQVLPECVKTESTGVMSVDTDNLTWYLINAVKELKSEINQLKGA